MYACLVFARGRRELTPTWGARSTVKAQRASAVTTSVLSDVVAAPVDTVRTPATKILPRSLNADSVSPERQLCRSPAAPSTGRDCTVGVGVELARAD